MGQVVNYTPEGKTSTTISAGMSGLRENNGGANNVSFSTNGKVEDSTINLLLDEKEIGKLVKPVVGSRWPNWNTNYRSAR